MDIIITKLTDTLQLNKGALSLCSNSLNEMQKWVNSILEFKQCGLNNQNINHNILIIDFANLNLAKSKQSSNKHYQLSDLYYNKASIHIKTRMSETTTKTISKAFSRIKSSIMRGNLARASKSKKVHS